MEKEGNEDRLFKYVKINDHTKDNLINNELFFSHPEDFNDPFDSKIEVEYKGTIKDWYYWAASRRKDIDKKDINQMIKDETIIEVGNGIFEINPTKNDKLLKDVAKNHYKICSFSETKLSILMWSHYADSHKGICLCFKTHKVKNHHLLEFLISESMSMGVSTPMLFPVDYHKPKQKKINMLTLPPEENIKLIEFYKRKHRDWKYEKEHRKIIFDKFGHEKGFTVKYRKEDLEGIIFGLKAKRKEIEVIINIISSYYLRQGIKVNFYSTHEIQGEFAIEVKKINDISEYLKTLS
ncbi:MAG: DUF2971 domain-containing protein [Candidatus Methanoperedens sp.]|nr:DUF2971 domain-containing protein [Candidatus Methanoperedens sp.]